MRLHKKPLSELSQLTVYELEANIADFAGVQLCGEAGQHYGASARAIPQLETSYGAHGGEELHHSRWQHSPSTNR